MNEQSIKLTPLGAVATMEETLAGKVMETLHVHAVRHAGEQIPAMVYVYGRWEFIGLTATKLETARKNK